jgi:hypothetical protein
MSRMGSVKKKVATLFLKKMSFLPELQPELIIFIGITNSCNIPGGCLKIIHQIRSKVFLVIKRLDLPLPFSDQKTLRLLEYTH